MISPRWTGDLRPLNGSLEAVAPGIEQPRKSIRKKVVVYLESPPILVFYKSFLLSPFSQISKA